MLPIVNNLTPGTYLELYSMGVWSPMAIRLIRVRDLSPGVRRSLEVGGSAYAALWCAALAAAAMPAAARETISPLPAAILVSVLGPPVCFVWGGVAAWAYVSVSMLIVGACVALARLSWRRHPESELFGVPLVAAIGVWVGSVWLAALLAAM